MDITKHLSSLRTTIREGTLAQRERTQNSWVWLLGLFTLASLVDAGFYGQINAFTPLQLKAYHLTPTQVTTATGLLASLTWAIGIPFLPLWGALADRYSRQPVIVRSFLAFLVAGLLMLIARDLWLFALGRAIMSFALGNSGLMMTTLAERVPKRRLGLAFAVMNSAAPIGYFAGPLAGGVVLDHWGFSSLLFINMGLVLLVALALAFGYHDAYAGKRDASLWRMMLDSVVLLVRSDSVRKLFAAIFVLFLGWEAILPYIPVAVGDLYRGADIGTVVGVVVGISGLVTLFVGPAMGALADRFGRWRVLLIGTALSVILLPLSSLAHSLTGFAIAWSVTNGLLSAILALSFTVLSDATPEETRGRIMAFSWLPIELSATVGASLGSVAARYSVWWLFPGATVMTLIGMGTLILAAPRKTSSAPLPSMVEGSSRS
jgi:MFS transporter, DHA1 family, multidrug resistance protein